ncbi:MAG: TerB family tellurite resistance protein [Methylophaga sp.]|nr:TerB family tellurite resistance protein [Methylophaga sp.]
MHIVLALLGSIATILMILSRLADAGIDLGGLNPFLWNRRRKWRKKYDGNPLFKIDTPLDATAILMVATAKADGDMSREDKTLLLNLFETKFNLSKKDAAGLMISSAHLLGNGKEFTKNVKSFLEPSKASFSDIQANSAIELVSTIAGDPSSMHENVQAFLQHVQQELTPEIKDQNKTW